MDSQIPDRQGPFWDVLRGSTPPPPAAVTLGWRLLEVDPTKGTAVISFQATEQFLNPAGSVQGGFLAAMLDDTLGPALAATLSAGEFAPTLDLNLQFLQSAGVGELIGYGRVVRRGSSIAFLAGELRDHEGTVVATATATAVIKSADGYGVSGASLVSCEQGR